MRRALDVAREKLETLGSADDVLDCFFDHAGTLFRHGVLLVVRGDAAHGRRVHGLETSETLVGTIVVPLNEPSVLERVRELRRPVVGVPTLTDADRHLFGTLGRT